MPAAQKKPHGANPYGCHFDCFDQSSPSQAYGEHTHPAIRHDSPKTGPPRRVRQNRQTSIRYRKTSTAMPVDAHKNTGKPHKKRSSAAGKRAKYPPPDALCMQPTALGQPPTTDVQRAQNALYGDHVHGKIVSKTAMARASVPCPTADRNYCTVFSPRCQVDNKASTKFVHVKCNAPGGPATAVRTVSNGCKFRAKLAILMDNLK